MAADDDRLLKLASSISDGTPVDWAGHDSRDAEEVGLLRELRCLEGIADLHRHPAPLELVTPEPKLGRFGHLELLEEIGSGSFGRVYRARDVRLDREVALKILSASDPRGAGSGFDARGSDYHDRVLREGRHLARVRHASVVAVHGAEISGGRVGIWMEFVNGRTLADIVKEQGRLSALEAASIGVVLCRALAAVHGAGLLHLDLKPRNVMREEGGRIVLMDFGMGEDFLGSPSGPAGIGGTPVYMAPERLEGLAPTPASDIYSLGVLLFYLVTGSHPVEGSTLDELWSAHDSGRVRHLRDLRPDLPSPFVQVVEKALAKDPAGRFASAGAMERALLRILDESEGVGDGLAKGGARSEEPPALAGAAPPGSLSTTPAPARRGQPGLILLLAGAVLVVGLISLATTRWIVPGKTVTSRDRTADQTAADRRSLEPGVPASSAPIPAPAGALTASSAAPYTIEASFQLGSAALPLRNGDRVAVGDSLSLHFRASEPLHVYVINEDDRGEAYLLFPLPGFQPANPLPAGEGLDLPGEREGRRFYWQVTSAGGLEHFLVIASRERFKELEADLLSLTQAQAGAPLQYARLSRASRNRVRGVAGLVEAAPEPAGSPPDRLYQLAQALPRGPHEVRGIWMRRIDLENPAP